MFLITIKLICIQKIVNGKPFFVSIYIKINYKMAKVVKVTAKQLQQIISEEASKYKKVLELKRKREEIMSQLNEMYEVNEVEELLGGQPVPGVAPDKEVNGVESETEPEKNENIE